MEAMKCETTEYPEQNVDYNKIWMNDIMFISILSVIFNWINFTHKATLPKLQTNKNKMLCKTNLNVLKYIKSNISLLKRNKYETLKELGW